MSKSVSDLLNFDCTSKQPNQSVFQAALAEVQEEHDQSLLKVAKEAINKMIEIKKEYVKVQQETSGRLKKLEKALAKAQAAVERMANGQPAPQESEEESAD